MQEPEKKRAATNAEKAPIRSQAKDAKRMKGLFGAAMHALQ